MKKISATILFVLFCQIAFSQNCIGLSKSQTINFFREETGDEYFSPDQGMSEDGYEYLMFMKKGDETYAKIYYFTNRGICFMNKFIYPYSDLTVITKVLNSKTEKIDSDQWKEYKKDYDLLWVIERKEEFFTLSGIIIETH